MKSMLIIAAIACSPLALACGSSPKPEPKTAQIKPSNDSDRSAKAAKDDDKGTTGMVNIATDVRKACGISDDEAYFAFNSANVRYQDRKVLGKLRACFTTGALKDRQMELVGHADPRGDDNYNLALGGRRADSVKSVIVNEGMPSSKVVTSSRGEMDATGTDEASWAKDRRVDVLAAR